MKVNDTYVSKVHRQFEIEIKNIDPNTRQVTIRHKESGRIRAVPPGWINQHYRKK